MAKRNEIVWKTLCWFNWLLYYYAGPSELKAHDSKTHEPILCQCSLSINSEKMKNRGFLIISRGREEKHWRETD